MILPVVMNSNFERLAVIDDYNSFIWTTRYYDCGDFELCVDVHDNSVDLFQMDYYILRDDDENVGIIENVKIQRNDDGHEMMIVSGRFLASIIGRRIISKQTQISGTVSNGIYMLLQNEIINPTIAERKISNFVCGTYTNSQGIEQQFTGDNLLTAITDICRTYNIGFKVILNDSNQYVFQMFNGVDRSYGQNVNPYVVFSDAYDNLLSSEYEENYKGIATNVLVAGEGEGLDRKTLWVTKTNPSGINRHEVYKDHRNIRSNDGEISDAEYQKLLREAGLEQLTSITQAFTGTVYFDNIVYKQDVNIGDICTIENARWGMYINARLVEVIESVNEAGEYSIVPSFGL